MRTTCVFVIAILAVFASGCFGGDDQADQNSMLGGLAQAMQQQQQMEQQAQLQAQQQAAAMQAQMQAEMLGQAAPQPAQPVAPAAPAAPGMIGVPECDQYLQKYPACLESKVPAMAKPQMMAGFEATKQAWMQMAATPQGKASLQMTCKMALDQAKMAMQIYGCQF